MRETEGTTERLAHGVVAGAFGDIQSGRSPGLRHPEKERQICSRTQLVDVVIVAEVIFVADGTWMVRYSCNGRRGDGGNSGFRGGI